MKSLYPHMGLHRLCLLFGYSRQSYYKHLRAEDRHAFTSALIVSLVKDKRQQMPGIGAKKLYFLLSEQIQQHQLKIGRDVFMQILRENDLLIRRRKKRVVTTWSKHALKKYPNIIRELTPKKPNKLWVSDITYIRVGGVWHYVIFIVDAYSRLVIGYNVDEHMDAEFCEVALDQALKQWKDRSQKLIHHSDRGLQYCSKLYTEKLLGNKILISMTENGDPLENAIAERVNGIFKGEFEMDQHFETLQIAIERIQQMVYHYNHSRPHASCNYLTPAQAHATEGLLPKRW